MYAFVQLYIHMCVCMAHTRVHARVRVVCTSSPGSRAVISSLTEHNFAFAEFLGPAEAPVGAVRVRLCVCACIALLVGCLAFRCVTFWLRVCMG